MEPIPSECKLEEFNSCPGAKRFMEALDEEAGDAALSIVPIFVDLDRSWENDGDTVVFTFNYEDSLTHERWATFMKFVERVHPDEFDWQYEGETAETERIYFRLWWD